MAPFDVAMCHQSQAELKGSCLGGMVNGGQEWLPFLSIFAPQSGPQIIPPKKETSRGQP